MKKVFKMIGVIVMAITILTIGFSGNVQATPDDPPPGGTLPPPPPGH